MKVKPHPTPKRDRSGAYVVEMAFVLPVFLLFLSFFYEFGHAYMVLHSIQGAAKLSAREAAIEGSNNSKVQSLIADTLSASFDVSKISVFVKDASAYDDTEIDPSTISWSDLPDFEVSNAASRQLFLIRIEVDYDDITIMPAFWRRIAGRRFAAQSVMRHE